MLSTQSTVAATRPSRRAWRSRWARTCRTRSTARSRAWRTTACSGTPLSDTRPPPPPPTRTRPRRCRRTRAARPHTSSRPATDSRRASRAPPNSRRSPRPAPPRHLAQASSSRRSPSRLPTPRGSSRRRFRCRARYTPILLLKCCPIVWSENTKYLGLFIHILVYLSLFLPDLRPSTKKTSSMRTSSSHFARRFRTSARL